jgi:hypothetical protein
MHSPLHLPFQTIAFPIKVSKSPYQYRSQKSEQVWKRGGIVLARTPPQISDPIAKLYADRSAETKFFNDDIS